MTPEEIIRVRNRLLARRAEIDALTVENDEARAVVMLDQQSVGRLARMDALQGQAMAQETARRRRAELTRITVALRRIGEDDYGWCSGCGGAIAPRRLELDPTLATCVRRAR